MHFSAKCPRTKRCAVVQQQTVAIHTPYDAYDYDYPDKNASVIQINQKDQKVMQHPHVIAPRNGKDKRIRKLLSHRVYRRRFSKQAN